MENLPDLDPSTWGPSDHGPGSPCLCNHCRCYITIGLVNNLSCVCWSVYVRFVFECVILCMWLCVCDFVFVSDY